MRRATAVLTSITVVVYVALATESQVAGLCSPGTVVSPQGNGGGQFISVSGTGRYVAFGSYATDLVPGDTPASAFELFALDTQTCDIERVSVSSSGTQANNLSWLPTISDDGRYVAFSSAASNLVTGDTNGTQDVFVRDRQAGTTVRVSVDSAGNETTSGNSTDPFISGNGQIVAFWSAATNLVAGDTNNLHDVFVHDLGTGVTSRVSVSSGGGQGSGGGGEDPYFHMPSLALSFDGRFVFFASTKTDLVPGDTNGVQDIFRHDRQTNTTIRVSVSSTGAEANGVSLIPSASDDGRYVAFTSSAENLVAEDANGVSDVFVRDITQSLTTRESVMRHGGQLQNHSLYAALSGDGRHLAFASLEPRLVTDDTNNAYDVFVRDRQTATVRRASRSAAGVQGNSSSTWLSLSNDGQVVGYFSNATNLVPGSLNTQDVFVTTWQSLPAPPAPPNHIQNGDFAAGLAPWTTFALPSPTDIVANASGGALNFHRPLGSEQGVALQSTGAVFLANTPLVATFDLGNVSNNRKRISVLVHDQDFSDLHVCTFWLEPNAPMRTYVIRTHPTRLWANATMSFYAATADGAPSYRLDNVSLVVDPDGDDLQTGCVDPTAPTPPGGAAGANLITNGGFTAGMTSWGTFGQIQSQVSGGVLEFIKLAGSPAGVLLQPTGQSVDAGEILTATFELGNSSSVRKRVTVLLHDNNFSDLSACTFWIPPGQPLSTYTYRTFATRSWTNATWSIYPATIGVEQWIRLDNITLARTPSAPISGTECLEPNGGGSSDHAMPGHLRQAAFAPVPFSAESIPVKSSEALDTSISAASSDQVWLADGFARDVGVSASARAPGWIASAANSRRHTLTSALPLEVSVSSGTVRFFSWLTSTGSRATVEVSVDGLAWETAHVIAGSDGWVPVDVDLSTAAAPVVYVRFVFDVEAPLDGTPDIWRIAIEQ